MAMQIGKREQIVVGVVIAVVAIAAIHLLFFQEKAKGETQKKAELDQLISKFNEVSKVPDKADLEKYKSESASDEELLWKVLSSMGLLVRAPFQLPTPLPTAAGAVTEKDKAYYGMVTKRLMLSIEAVVAARFDRLLDMKKAYEAGEKWVGDTGYTSEDAQPRTMKLTFLGVGEKRWALTTGVDPSITTKPALWDAVDHIHETWQVLRLLNADSADYESTAVKYRQNLKALGLDFETLEPLRDVNAHLPELKKLLLAREVWQRKDADETVRIGDDTLNLALLKEMLTYEPPNAMAMFMLYRQLTLLEHLLVMARQCGVADIEEAQLPPDKLIVTYDAAAIKAGKEKEAVRSVPLGAPKKINVPPPARRGAAAGSGGPGGAPGTGGPSDPASVRVGGGAAPPAFAAAGEAGSASAPARSPAVSANANMIPNPKRAGQAVLVSLAYTATNEASMRLLYAITTAPQSYKVEGITIDATSEEGLEKVQLTVQAIILVDGVSTSGNLLDAKTGEPVPIMADAAAAIKEAYAKVTEDEKARGIDEAAIAAKAMTDYGLPEATPTPEPTPAGGAAAPGAPGGPGGAAKPSAGAPAGGPPAMAGGASAKAGH